MQAMQFVQVGTPLQLVERPIPRPAEHQVLLKVHACGVCRTDLHIVDGELTQPKLPLILGHQIVGTIVQTSAEHPTFPIGMRVGVPWLGHTCNHCHYCQSDRENLCDQAAFTGYQIDGGYAEYAVADGQFCFPIPDGYPDVQAAPLLCAGLIGYRALRLAGAADRLGLYGFGAAAHIVTQIAKYQGRQVFAFTRPQDFLAQEFAQELGADWVGAANELPPTALDAAIIFASAGELVPAALRSVAKGGTVVCAGIHMSDIPAFPYEILWGERMLRSVANLTRQDGLEFLPLVPKIPIQTSVQSFPLAQANKALQALRQGKIRGAAVLHILSPEND
jgi:alcohol dehydrogenase, propanol-preferring